VVLSLRYLESVVCWKEGWSECSTGYFHAKQGSFLYSWLARGHCLWSTDLPTRKSWKPSDQQSRFNGNVHPILERGIL